MCLVKIHFFILLSFLSVARNSDLITLFSCLCPLGCWCRVQYAQDLVSQQCLGRGICKSSILFCVSVPSGFSLTTLQPFIVGQKRRSHYRCEINSPPVPGKHKAVAQCFQHYDASGAYCDGNKLCSDIPILRSCECCRPPLGSSG